MFISPFYQSIPSLVELDSNSITFLPSGVFNGLNSLSFLFLSFFPQTSFLQPSSIWTLHYNKLTSLPSGVFNGLNSLSSLDLTLNHHSTSTLQHSLSHVICLPTIWPPFPLMSSTTSPFSKPSFTPSNPHFHSTSQWAFIQTHWNHSIKQPSPVSEILPHFLFPLPPHYSLFLSSLHSCTSVPINSPPFLQTRS